MGLGVYALTTDRSRRVRGGAEKPAAGIVRACLAVIPASGVQMSKAVEKTTLGRFVWRSGGTSRRVGRWSKVPTHTTIRGRARVRT
ncbi:hypothetical protein SKAU_G00252060 [Synaphobranchus kaupii]|uniref:Uncharacterized protein n=1 Tax=Synaphobranchus kaupii TaxID=118154 RepID=A0A9Q1IR19_SYNKA|nr:hypothetical protein SKAU_G00252060 [Synaphobranchus kaupii]